MELHFFFREKEKLLFWIATHLGKWKLQMLFCGFRHLQETDYDCFHEYYSLLNQLQWLAAKYLLGTLISFVSEHKSGVFS